MALMLRDYIDVVKLEQYVREGLVDEKMHPQFPLSLYCYGRKAVYDNVWDDCTTRCRGLIVNNQTGEIIARPFEKFFNLGTADIPETHLANLPDGQPIITTKLDGSLGILYRYDGVDYIASKGSFVSEHANWATAWFRSHVGARGAWPKGYTPVFEMICEQVQRHVVNYGGNNDGLILTAIISVDTGWELPPDVVNYWAGQNRLRSLVHIEKTVDEVVQENNPNEEGYVLAWPRPGNDTFSSPFRVKIKFVDFLRLQRVLHSVGPKEILDALRHKHLRGYFSDWLNADTMPKEFIQYVHEWMQKFGREFGRIRGLTNTEVQCARTMLSKDVPRKEFALRFVQKPYPAILFATLDGNAELRDSLIWEECKKLAKEARPLWEATDGEE